MQKENYIPLGKLYIAYMYIQYSIYEQFPLPEEILQQTEEWDIQEFSPTSLDNLCNR